MSPSKLKQYPNTQIMTYSPENIPLVSIVVYVYNSEAFIIETLESIKAQTYPKLELIITDDLSKDSTLELVEEWIDINKLRFERTQVVRATHNTGIAGNNNRGLAATTGEWVKFVPGDDLLFPEAVSILVTQQQNPLTEFVYSNVILFRDHVDNVLKQKGALVEAPLEANLVKENKILAMSTLIKRSRLVALGGFDERYPMIDDWPLWLKMAENKVNFEYIDKTTAGYRKHNANVSKTGVSRLYLQSWVSFCKDQLIPKGWEYGFYEITYYRSIDKIVFNLQSNFKNAHIIKAINTLHLLKPRFLQDYIKQKKQNFA